MSIYPWIKAPRPEAKRYKGASKNRLLKIERSVILRWKKSASEPDTITKKIRWRHSELI
jgi:intein-encoded DNA endonuclease-like protein